MSVLFSIGASFALDKCKFIASPGFGVRPLVFRDVNVTYVSSYKFLGVRIVFKLSCQAVLSARLAS